MDARSSFPGGASRSCVNQRTIFESRESQNEPGPVRKPAVANNRHSRLADCREFLDFCPYMTYGHIWFQVISEAP